MFADNCGAIFKAPSGTNSAAYTVTSLSGSANAAAQLTVTVTDSSNTRSSVSSIAVSVLPALSLLVSVVSNFPAAVMNAGDVLKLSGVVSLPAGTVGNAVWSVDDTSGFVFANVARNPVSLPSITQNNYVYMVIGANSLPVGATLTFSLTSQIASEATATVASVTVTINAPPLPGNFAVTPESGTELVKPFTFSATQW